MDETKKDLKGSFSAKTAAFILTIIFALLSLGFMAVFAADISMGAFDSPREEVTESVLREVASNRANDFLTLYKSGSESALAEFAKNTNAVYTVVGPDGQVIYGEAQSESDYYVFHTVLFGASAENGESNNEVVIYVSRTLTQNDRYSLAAQLVGTAYTLRYWSIALAVLCFVLMLLCFIFLMNAAAHKNGVDGLWAGPMTKVPFDLFTAGCVGLVVLCGYAVTALGGFEVFNFSGIQLELFTLAVVAAAAVCIGWCVDFAARIKLKKYWKNAIIYIVLRFIWLVLVKICRGIGYFFRHLTLIWKIVVILLVMGIYGIITVAQSDPSARGWMLVIGGMIVIWLAVYSAVSLKKLQQGGEKLAEGDLNYKVDVSKMYGDFKAHGENLNSIAVGMSRAVDERMKSERLKTELITNVSHDIKTPLTSIINYTDLISKEECDNEKISEYTAVLSRQSERLKKLIEDLVEASKASTGNIEAHLAPCDAGVLLEQTAGEYAEKLRAAGLDLVISKPDEPVIISADGRLLWRVFDNLMNNICKYSQTNTRVYITVSGGDDDASIEFKNISGSPLNISAEELMERFVRGDASRHTEGSGLGLSIARSLTELQNGTFRIDIDGDLFKAKLCFKKI